MPPEQESIPEPRPTMPAGALAIDRLVQAVENMRAEVAAQGALSNRERTSVLDALARFDQALKTVVHDLQQVKRTVFDAVERIEKLEAATFRRMKLKTKAKRSRKKPAR